MHTFGCTWGPVKDGFLNLILISNVLKCVRIQGNSCDTLGLLFNLGLLCPCQTPAWIIVLSCFLH